MKRIFNLFVLLIAAITAFAVDFSVGGYDFYIISSTELTVGIEKCNINSGTINIPEAVNYRNKKFDVIAIGSRAFEDNKAEKINLPNTITSIGDYAFLACNATSIILSENLSRIGKSAFMRSNIESITIPDSYEPDLRNTLSHTFRNCKNLKSVTLGKNCAGRNGQYLIAMWSTFRGCDNLEEIIIFSPIPPYWQERDDKFTETNEPFDIMSYTFTTLKVPSESLVDYKSAPAWKKFGTIASIDGLTLYQSTLNKANNLLRGIKSRDNTAQYLEKVDNNSQIPQRFFYCIWDLSDGKMCIAGGIVPQGGNLNDMKCEFVGIVNSLMDFVVPTKNGGTLSFNGNSNPNTVTVSEPNKSYTIKVEDLRQY